MDRSQLESYYREHHASRQKQGFSVSEAERGALFAEWIGRGHDVLDLGCRDGTLTRHYLEENRVTGVDIDTEALKRARHDLAEIGAFRTASFDLNCRFPLEDDRFDRAIMGEVLEHTIFPDVVMGEVFRCLRSGGCFIGSVPNTFRLRNRVLFLLGRDCLGGDPTHLHHFHPDTLRRLLAEAGFQRVELRTLGGRFRQLHPLLIGRRLVWRCWKG